MAKGRSLSFQTRGISLILLLFLSTAAGLFLVRAEEYPIPEYRSVGKGIKYALVEIKGIPLIYHVLRVDLNEAGLRVRPIRGKGRDETIAKMSSRILESGEPLIAAVNGDYFRPGNKNTFCPWGILIEDNEIIFSPTNKSVLVIGEDGVPRIAVLKFKSEISFGDRQNKVRVLSVNRNLEPGPGECCLFTSGWSAPAPEREKGFAVTVLSNSKLIQGETAGKVAGLSRMPVGIPIPEEGYVLVFGDSTVPGFKNPGLGESVSLSIELSLPAYQAIGGGPRLVRDGKVSVETSEEEFTFGKAAYLVRGKHPRTAVGCTDQGRELIIAVVEGRSQSSRGMKMGGLADLMGSLGAWQAMSFDGGRSAGLFLEGKQIVKGQRIICDALGIFRR